MANFPRSKLWARLIYDAINRCDADRSEAEIMQYCKRLLELGANTTDATLSFVLEHVAEFARSRAMFLAMSAAIRMMEGGEDISAICAMYDNVARRVTPDQAVESDAVLLAADIPESEPVIEGLLDRGEVAVFGSASKSHKTWANIALAIGIAYTGTWWGFRCRQGKVLFLNFELTRKAFQTRLRATYERLGIKPDGRIDVMHLKGVEFTEPGSLLASLGARVRREGYILVIIDPLYQLEGGASTSTKGRDDANRENSNYIMGRIMGQFISLAARANCAVWVCHHFSKGNQASKDALDRLAGAGALGRALDTAVIMTKHKATDPAAGIRAYSIELEARNHPEIDPFAVRWDYPVLVEDPSLDPADLAEARRPGQGKDHRPEDLLECFVEGMDTREFQTAAQRQLGVSRASFFRLRSVLEKSGKLVETGRKWYVPEHPKAVNAKAVVAVRSE